jgi:hypothetical protein
LRTGSQRRPLPPLKFGLILPCNYGAHHPLLGRQNIGGIFLRGIDDAPKDELHAR